MKHKIFTADRTGNMQFDAICMQRPNFNLHSTCLPVPLSLYPSLCLSLSWFPRPSVCLRHVVALGDAIISALQIAKFASPEKSISVFKASVLLLLQENTLYLCATSKLCTRYVEYHNMPTSCIHSFIHSFVAEHGNNVARMPR